jgi:hypothetical protein
VRVLERLLGRKTLEAKSPSIGSPETDRAFPAAKSRRFKPSSEPPLPEKTAPPGNFPAYYFHT